LRFSELFNKEATRNDLIATFLALLEIIKLKHTKVKQSDLFGEIIIEKA
ncbi:segregation/condensation protein A, partial [Candidatus Omnitrophota bacterium]